MSNKKREPKKLDYAALIVTFLWLSYIYSIILKSDTGIVGTIFICVWGIVLVVAYLIQKG